MKCGAYCMQYRGEIVFGQGSNDILQFKKGPDKDVALSDSQIQRIVDFLNGTLDDMKLVNLDPIQTDGVLRIVLEGKMKVDIILQLIADSDLTVLLE